MKFVGEIAVSGVKNDERLAFERFKSSREFGLEGGEFRVEGCGVRSKELGVFRGRFAKSGGRLFDKASRDGGARPNVRVEFRIRTGMRMGMRRMVAVGFGMRMSARLRKESDVFAKIDGA